MKKDQTTQYAQLADKLKDLLDRAKNIGQKIDKTSNKARVALDDIDLKVSESIATLENIYSDLGQIEREAGDEIDNLILQQAEDLTEE